MAMMEISVIPIGTGKPGVSRYVAACLEAVEESSLEHELTAMGTIVVGPVPALLALAGRLHELPLAMGAPRTVTTIKLDERRDRELTIAGKVDDVIGRRHDGEPRS
ncbi:MAG: MTH1187 family thiamine-binding protein [Deltaproteobacteria bacterium]|nr:MTH1187 family thiamine-binding protein [Candidatus Anaeroferrophillacea bacterium]